MYLYVYIQIFLFITVPTGTLFWFLGLYSYVIQITVICHVCA